MQVEFLLCFTAIENTKRGRYDMRSQDVRRLAPEMDPLRIGMGWSVEDLE